MSGENGGLPLGTTTVVSVEVGRNELPALIRAVLGALTVDLDGAPEGYVYLPHSTRTFGTISGRGITISQFVPEPTQLFRTRRNGAYLRLAVAELGHLFGWMVNGMRLEFHTLRSETYTAVVSYDCPDGEEWQLGVLSAMLAHGHDSCAYALTKAAAERNYRRYHQPG